jgi:tripartite-type tricarboxylate transporter receptor subunit TctC
MTTGGTPQPIVERIAAELHTVVSQPETVAAFEKLGMSVRYLGPREFADYYDREIKRWAAAVEFSGARPD